jgi:hypothetical protein
MVSGRSTSVYCSYSPAFQRCEQHSSPVMSQARNQYAHQFESLKGQLQLQENKYSFRNLENRRSCSSVACRAAIDALHSHCELQSILVGCISCRTSLQQLSHAHLHQLLPEKQPSIWISMQLSHLHHSLTRCISSDAALPAYSL